MKTTLNKSIKQCIQVGLIVALVQILFLVALQSGSISSANSGSVDIKGLKVEAKAEYPVSGNLTALNGKYKLRLTESVLEPGGYMNEHKHVGPGIRFIESGALTSIHPGKTVIYQAGEHFYEAGAEMHQLWNKTNAPVRILNFELLPIDWQGISAVPLHGQARTLQPASTSTTPADAKRP